MTPTAHVEPGVWIKVLCQDMLSLTACCWLVARATSHPSSLQQEDWIKMDQSTKNLSALNLPKKDGPEQVSSCFIVTQEQGLKGKE